MTYIQAFVRNAGTISRMPRGKFRAGQTCKEESTEVVKWGGVARSSNADLCNGDRAKGPHLYAEGWEKLRKKRSGKNVGPDDDGHRNANALFGRRMYP